MRPREFRMYGIRATKAQTKEMFRDAIAGAPTLWDRYCGLSDIQFHDILGRVVDANNKILSGQCEPDEFDPSTALVPLPQQSET